MRGWSGGMVKDGFFVVDESGADGAAEHEGYEACKGGVGYTSGSGMDAQHKN